MDAIFAGAVCLSEKEDRKWLSEYRSIIMTRRTDQSIAYCVSDHLLLSSPQSHHLDL
jgi:hypothetical protein